MNINPIGNTANLEWYSWLSKNESVLLGADSAAQNSVDSLILSRSTTIESYLYSAQSMQGAQTALAATLTAAEPAAAQENTAAEPDATQSLASGNYRAAFLEIIKNRVQFLLEALINAQGNGNSESAIQPTLLSPQETAGVSDSINLDYWSPEKTASRIVDFALGFYNGGDREGYAAMVKDAVTKGYYEAMKSAGGNLPDIANQTISLVMDAIDQFAAGNGVDVVA